MKLGMETKVSDLFIPRTQKAAPQPFFFKPDFQLSYQKQ